MTGRHRRCAAALGVALAVSLLAGACATGPALSPGTGPAIATGEPSGTTAPALPSDLPAASAAAAPSGAGAGDFPGTVILGAPTDASVLVSIMVERDGEITVEHGPAAGSSTTATSVVPVLAGEPVEIALSGLLPDTAWQYRVRYRESGGGGFIDGPTAVFHTQRAPGSPFTFAVDADAHVGYDDKAQGDLFRQTLANIAAETPDFLVDLGDTFMGDKLARSRTGIASVYASLRSDFAISGASVPLLLVNGNHEGEAGWSLKDGAAGVGTQAAEARRTYYPNPEPVGFYNGGAPTEAAGLRDSMYAWTWGDAQFIVLDPYSATERKPGADAEPWGWTLGEAQYRWLSAVLHESTSRYRFVFIHHVVGDVRGGVEAAALGEWGGQSNDGTNAFAAERPGWPATIHDLFVETGVTMVFQGHDHLYVRQELDGIVYQEVPQPATVGGNAEQMAAEYGYRSGDVLPSPGHLQVTVAPSGVTVSYIHTSTGAGDRSGLANGDVAASYTIAAPQGVAP